MADAAEKSPMYSGEVSNDLEDILVIVPSRFPPYSLVVANNLSLPPLVQPCLCP